MKVIFLKNNHGGKVGEVKEVALGFAKNFLLPQRIAVPATPASLQSLKDQEGIHKKRQQKKAQRVSNLIQRLGRMKIQIKKKANEEGTLFAALQPADIVQYFKEKKYKVDSTMFRMAEPIKQVGEYKVSVVVDHEEPGELTIVVIPEA